MTAKVSITKVEPNTSDFGISQSQVIVNEVTGELYTRTLNNQVKRVGADTTFTPSGIGAVSTTVQDELRTWIRPEQFGATGGADDSAAVLAALTKLKADGGGTLVLSKLYNCASQISLAGAKGIRILALSSSTQTTGGSGLSYSGTASPFLNFSGGASIFLDGVNVRYTSGSFTGTLVAFPLCAGVYIDKSSLMGNGSSTGLYLLSLDTATDIRIASTTLDNCQYGILGQAVSGAGYANSVTLDEVRFGNGITVKDIRNPGQSWRIKADFEALANGKGGAITVDAGVTAKGVDIQGSWFGDATDVTAWSWIQWRGNSLSIHGSKIHGTGGLASTAVQVLSTSSGISITGNEMPSHSIGLDLGSLLSSNVEFYGNDLTSTTTHYSGTPAGLALLQSNSLALEIWSAGVRQLSINGTTGNAIFNGSVTAGEGNFANSLKVTGGILYPSTPAQVAQTACEIYAGSGAPSNANGSNGAFYFRSDGTKAGSTVIYHKETGAWVALTS